MKLYFCNTLGGETLKQDSFGLRCVHVENIEHIWKKKQSLIQDRHFHTDMAITNTEASFKNGH